MHQEVQILNADWKKQMVQGWHIQTPGKQNLGKYSYAEKPGNGKQKIQNSGSFEGGGYGEVGTHEGLQSTGNT